METADSAVENIMTTANHLADVISKIGEITILLAQKRVTLEEKMLRRYLHELAKTSAQTIALLHQLTNDGAKGNSDSFDEIACVTAEARTAIEELLKVAKYNLNFLEQYYEYDFYNKLVNDYKFVERLETASLRLHQITQSD